jgi:hypothetical protein
LEEIKSTIFIFILLFSYCDYTFSQGTAINFTGNAADNSAMLDVSDTSQGILIPRMSDSQRDAIPLPAIGLLIYNSSAHNFNYYKSTGWYELPGAFVSSITGIISPGGGMALNLAGNSADSSAMLDVNSTNGGLLIPRTITSSIASPATGLIIFDISNNNFKYYNGSVWKTICESFITTITGTGSPLAAGIAVNTTGVPADPSAMLDISSSTKGILIPRLTTLQRNKILPKAGLTIYNTTTNTIDYYNSSGWYSMETDIPAAPTAGIHIPSQTQIVWNWNTVNGSTGYKWNTTNDYATATITTNTSYIQTGLVCNTPYTLYVWAYNACGNSPVTILTQTTSPCWTCGGTLVVTHTAGSVAPVTKTVSYGTVATSLSGASQCWITQNLGADHQATAYNDATEASGGWYWQFNRMQGYKHDGTTRTPNTTWDITNDNTYSGWDPAKDPCTLLLGTGWRLPTYTEWNNADINGNWNTFISTYVSVLKIHAAGFLYNSNGSLGSRGGVGGYWSSTQSSSSNAWKLNFDLSICDMYASVKSYGFPLRCLR